MQFSGLGFRGSGYLNVDFLFRLSLLHKARKDSGDWRLPLLMWDTAFFGFLGQGLKSSKLFRVSNSSFFLLVLVPSDWTAARTWHRRTSSGSRKSEQY